MLRRLAMYASSKAETEETEAENTAAETTEEEEDEAEDANVPSKPPAPGASRGAALLAAAATGDPAAEGTGTSRRLVSSPRVICAVDFGTTFTGVRHAEGRRGREQPPAARRRLASALGAERAALAPTALTCDARRRRSSPSRPRRTTR